MEKENREKERFIEYINHYLQKASVEQLKALYFYSKYLVESPFMEDEMSTENKQKERYVEWIYHYSKTT